MKLFKKISGYIFVIQIIVAIFAALKYEITI